MAKSHCNKWDNSGKNRSHGSTWKGRILKDEQDVAIWNIQTKEGPREKQVQSKTKLAYPGTCPEFCIATVQGYDERFLPPKYLKFIHSLHVQCQTLL